jgi:hypothetical protein
MVWSNLVQFILVVPDGVGLLLNDDSAAAFSAPLRAGPDAKSKHMLNRT